MRNFPSMLLAAVLLAAGLPAAATHRSSETRPESLQPGEFAWYAEAAPAGPLLLIVSLPEQRAYLYRNGVRIAVSTVSTGKAGYETPAGVFTILQKHKEHYSNLYDDAPMPFMQRLTWDGVALHAGRLPGYPASHGCVRLPLEFARRLFDVSALGMTVIVAAEHSEPVLAHPGWLVPEVAGAAPPVAAAPGAFDDYTWDPARSPTGPVTLLLSAADRRVRVLRNGAVIGDAPVVFTGPLPSGTRVLQLQSGTRAEASRFVPGRPRLAWVEVDIDPVQGVPSAWADEIYRNVQVPPEFARAVYDILLPGTTVVLTDEPFTEPGTDGPVLDAEFMPPGSPE
jgi:hypothetical protein